jgi:2Fe-2S ferredoxin
MKRKLSGKVYSMLHTAYGIRHTYLVPKVTFHYSGQIKTVDAENGKTLLQIALDNGIPIEHACGGNGFCTTCLCHVKKGMEALNLRNDREENMGVTEDPNRLSCQAQVQGDVEIEVVEY